MAACHPWDSPGKNTGVGCRFLLQCMNGKSESEVTQSCPTFSDPMDCSPPGSSVHGISHGKNTGSGLPCSPPGDLPDPGIKTVSLKSPALAGRFFTTSATWEAPQKSCLHSCRLLKLCKRILRRRQWHPTPALLPGKSHGRRSLVGCSPWGR